MCNNTGVGGGIGVTPLSTTNWYMGFVNNVCPECKYGDLDQNIDGDGRWRIEWSASMLLLMQAFSELPGCHISTFQAPIKD